MRGRGGSGVPGRASPCAGCARLGRRQDGEAEVSGTRCQTPLPAKWGDLAVLRCESQARTLGNGVSARVSVKGRGFLTPL